jgi:uncharacterized repeat protein (TIGR01451 family)
VVTTVGRFRPLLTFSVALCLSASALLMVPASASADPGPSTTQLSASNTTSLYGSAVTLQAQVTGAGVPTGSVTFVDGATTIGSAALDATGVAQLSIATLVIGTHGIVASYAGDANNAPSASTPVNISVFQRTKTDLLVSARPKAPGATWTPTTPLVLVANVIRAAPAGAKRAPTGTVTFSVDGVKTVVPVAGLHDAGLNFPNGLPLGTHTAQAHYNGDSVFAPSTSSVRTIKVLRNLTTSISDAPDPVVAGASVAYTVTVTNNGLASAASVQVVDTLPAGTTFVSATATGGCTGTGPVTCLLGTLAIHASRTATIVVQTSPPPPPGTITDTATALAGMNNVAVESTVVSSP